jgi:ABC-type multidrug transport system fused ATPase/permease subunit
MMRLLAGGHHAAAARRKVVAALFSSQYCSQQSFRRKMLRSSHTHHKCSIKNGLSSLLSQKRCCYTRFYFSSTDDDGNNNKNRKSFLSRKSADKDENKTNNNNTNSLLSSLAAGPPLNVDLEPPNISRILSILKPEVTSLLLALGALTVSTAATLQFPNAIGEMIDILSSSAAAGVVSAVDGSTIAVDDGNLLLSNMSEVMTNNYNNCNTIANSDDISNSVAGSSSNSDDDSTIIQQLGGQHQQEQLEQIQSIALQMLGFFTIGSAATFYHSTSFETIGQKIGARLRKQLFSTIIHQNISFFDQNRGGELANRLSTDVHEVAEHLVQNISIFMSNMVRSITAVASMIAISPALTLYLTPLPLALGGCAAVYGKFIKIWSKKHLDVLAHSTHMATERFGGITTVLSFGRRQSEVTNYSNVVESAYIFARKVAIFQGAFLGSSYLVGNTALMGTLVVGATFVIDGSMTAGQLAGFCMFAGHLAESGRLY